MLSFLTGFEFVTIVNLTNNSSNNYWLGKKTKAFLTDLNIQFVKKVSAIEEKNNNFTEVLNSPFTNDHVIRIAETSFKYSRFLNDPYLPSEKAQHIYGDITKNALKKAGRFFVTYKKQEITQGFILFSLNELDSSSTIDLIVVDQNYRGHGVGQSLLRSMEVYLHKRNIRIIKVGTQLDNINALRFYTLYGFEIFECNSIYHYWPLKS